MEKNKKIIFIICGIIILVILIVVGTMLILRPKKETVEEKKTSPTTTKNEPRKYKLNEDITVNTKDGKYRLKIKNIKETTERSPSTSVKADRVVIIEWEYENISLERELYISDWYFKAYDKDGNELEKYPAVKDIKAGNKITSGNTSVANAAYALNNKENLVYFNFYFSLTSETPACTIELEW